MSKVKSVSFYTKENNETGYWSTPTPLGADIENIDITNEVQNGTDETSVNLNDNNLIIQEGDTGATALTKINKLKQRLVNALNLSSNTSIAKAIILAAHPVGSYYWSSESTNPSELFGGTWESVENKFIFAAGSGYTVGSTGGAEEVELEIANMPKHRHTLLLQSDSGTNDQYIKVGKYDGIAKGEAMKYGWEGWEGGTTSLAEGESIPHENMPPYIVAYCWHRTA